MNAAIFRYLGSVVLSLALLQADAKGQEAGEPTGNAYHDIQPTLFERVGLAEVKLVTADPHVYELAELARLISAQTGVSLVVDPQEQRRKILVVDTRGTASAAGLLHSMEIATGLVWTNADAPVLRRAQAFPGNSGKQQAAMNHAVSMAISYELEFVEYLYAQFPLRMQTLPKNLLVSGASKWSQLAPADQQLVKSLVNRGKTVGDPALLNNLLNSAPAMEKSRVQLLAVPLLTLEANGIDYGKFLNPLRFSVMSTKAR